MLNIFRNLVLQSIITDYIQYFFPLTLSPKGFPDWQCRFSSVAQSSLTLCDPLDCSTPGFPVHRQLPELTQTRPLSQWCHPTISSSVIPFFSCLQSFLESGYFPLSQFFSIRRPKYWSFSFSIRPSNECSGVISFRIDWFDLLAVQGTL